MHCPECCAKMKRYQAAWECPKCMNRFFVVQTFTAPKMQPEKMTRQDLLDQVAALCVKFEDQHEQSSKFTIGCYVSIGDLLGIYEFNGLTMDHCDCYLAKLPLNDDEE